ncbi:Ig-like domain-containing protein [Jutongia huaianensis]|uniref:Ig-like domain-containing protein n=1 Tax=Jutongia huaianensis TaxID=2763668 RepID=A0ABR7MZ40_9FIRM|nr:Ig-like domain-containing protein [Jutongia huaianensis]MBC8561648.1 Ig-like domain-containing protein [Jutongia huaianensis]
MNVGKKILCGMITLCLIGQSLGGINVAAAKSNAVKLNITKKKISVGSSFQLKVKGKVSRKTVVTWKSSNKKIAVVSQKGKVTGKKAGKTQITVTVGGNNKKAVCKVTVQKKKNSSSKPVTTLTPDSNVVPSSPVPGVADNPTVSQAPASTASPEASAKTADSSVLVVSESLVELDGEIMTAYLVNKNYSGNISVSLNGKNYTHSDKISGKDLLVMLALTYTPNEPKVNHEGTISLYRGEEDEYWTVEDMELNKKYYLKAIRTNTLDPSWADCGVIYVKGDVRTEVGFQTNTQ